jgi:hypothetical protein
MCSTTFLPSRRRYGISHSLVQRPYPWTTSSYQYIEFAVAQAMWYLARPVIYLQVWEILMGVVLDGVLDLLRVCRQRRVRVVRAVQR